MIKNGPNAGQTAMAATPTTLAKLEDPRAWHARGGVGIQPKPTDTKSDAIALPMAPPLPKGRVVPAKKLVLEEDEYVERLGDIIEGDYFPHNAKMHRALLALARGTAVAGMTPSGTGFIGTPSSARLSTPGGSTPGRGESGGGTGGAGGGERAAGTGGALTKFVAKHTSEDNQAFVELQEKDQEAFRRRYFWAYDTADANGSNSVSTKLLILPDGKMMSVERRALMDAACADRPKIGDDRPNQVETWKHRTRNQLMFSPNLAASNDTCRIEPESPEADPLLLEETASKSRAERPLITQSGEAKKKRPRGGAPRTGSARGAAGDDAERQPAVSSLAAASLPTETSASDEEREGAAAADPAVAWTEGESTKDPLLSSTQDSDVDETGSSSTHEQREESAGDARAVPRATVVIKTNPKVIQAHATRFPAPKPRPPRQGPWASPIERPSSSRESVAGLLAGASGSPDYAEVPMTPSRVPGVDGDSPQITWGSIDGTPMILDPRATPLPDGSLPAPMDFASIVGALGGDGGPGVKRFEIKDLPTRDKLAHRLEAVDTRRKRAKLGLRTDGSGNKQAQTPGSATPLTPRTPGAGRSKTPGTAQRTPGSGRRTPGTGRSRDSRGVRGVAAGAGATPLTPAARTLAAKLGHRKDAGTPFGGGLTPGRQKRRSGSRRGSGSKGGGLTPLPVTPAGGVRVGSATPVEGRGASTEAEGGKQSSLTDGLLAMK